MASKKSDHVTALNPFGHDIPKVVVSDLIGRFLSNIPLEVQRDLVRMCFQIELAHWMFVDRYCTRPGASLSHLAHIPYSTFAAAIFNNTPRLIPHAPFVEGIIENFRDYKSKIPTFGGILLNNDMTQVLMVQGFGNSWGFPKGKVNQEEDEVVCAVREVVEETGYDCGHLINPNHYIESINRSKKDRLYIVVGVNTNYGFRPNTSYEIRQIAWFNIEELPEHKKDNVVSNRGYTNTNFYTIYPYVRRLKRWIADKVSGANQLNNFNCVSPPRSDFPFPYPMGFRGGHGLQHTFPDEWGTYDSPDEFGPDIKESIRGAEGDFNSFLNCTPKSDTRKSNYYGVPILSQYHPEKADRGRGPVPLSVTINPKRRLFVDEDEDTEKVQTKDTNSQVGFLDGPGAKAWLNFKFDVDQIMSAWKV